MMPKSVLLKSSGVRFICAGLVGFATYYALLYLLTEYVGWWYLTSAMTALIVNYSVTFYLQKVLTFGDRTTHVLGRQIGAYVLMVSCFYAFNSIALYVLVDWMGMWYMAAQIVISAFLTIVSYLISKKLYSPRPPTV